MSDKTLSNSSSLQSSSFESNDWEFYDEDVCDVSESHEIIESDQIDHVDLEEASSSGGSVIEFSPRRYLGALWQATPQSLKSGIRRTALQVLGEENTAKATHVARLAVNHPYLAMKQSADYFVPGSGELIDSVAQTGSQLAKQTLDELHEVVSNPVDSVVKGAESIFPGSGAVIEEYAESAQEMIDDATNSLNQTYESVQESLQNFAEDTINSYSDFGDFIWQSAESFLPDSWMKENPYQLANAYQQTNQVNYLKQNQTQDFSLQPEEKSSISLEIERKEIVKETEKKQTQKFDEDKMNQSFVDSSQPLYILSYQENKEEQKGIHLSGDDSCEKLKKQKDEIHKQTKECTLAEQTVDEEEILPAQDEDDLFHTEKSQDEETIFIESHEEKTEEPTQHAGQKAPSFVVESVESQQSSALQNQPKEDVLAGDLAMEYQPIDFSDVISSSSKNLSKNESKDFQKRNVLSQKQIHQTDSEDRTLTLEDRKENNVSFTLNSEDGKQISSLESNQFNDARLEEQNLENEVVLFERSQFSIQMLLPSQQTPVQDVWNVMLSRNSERFIAAGVLLVSKRKTGSHSEMDQARDEKDILDHFFHRLYTVANLDDSQFGQGDSESSPDWDVKMEHVVVRPSDVQTSTQEDFNLGDLSNSSADVFV